MADGPGRPDVISEILFFFYAKKKRNVFMEIIN